MTSSTQFRRRSAQSGAVLVTGLVFLVVLTMFVLALVRSGTLEERMARNARDQHIAREAAESVLRDAEASLFRSPPFDRFVMGSFSNACTNGFCYRPDADKRLDKIDWKSTSVTRGFSDAKLEIADLHAQPRYVVELMEPPRKPNSSMPCTDGLARVTARGEGKDGAVAQVQSTVRFKVYSGFCN